ncbi:MAG: thioredoxin domain-containing protein [Ignavibacteriales bacterium]|nr:thioredoxin domain-containing protein [Ignavibacteriales bacterium]
MISAFARAYQVLGNAQYLEASQQSARFIMSHVYDIHTQRLYRRYRDGEARFDGTLQDYAFLITGLHDLYEASFDIEWLEHSIDLTKKQIELFWDPIDGGFFDTHGKDSTILIRTKEDYDGAEPTGNSIAAFNLLRLSQATDNKEWRKMAEKTIMSFGDRLQKMPDAAAQMLVAVDWRSSTPKEIIIAGNPSGEDTKLMVREVHSTFIPNKIILLADGGERQKKIASFLPFVESMTRLQGKATAYVCENYACQLPTSDVTVLSGLLRNAHLQK